MHEMGIAMQIVEIAMASIPADLEDVKVEKVNLAVGKLSAVVPDSLQFCFKIASQDTPLAHAVLSIDEIPVRARCQDCRKEWTITKPVFTCIDCGSGAIDVLSGRELDIISIEVAD